MTFKIKGITGNAESIVFQCKTWLQKRINRTTYRLSYIWLLFYSGYLFVTPNNIIDCIFNLAYLLFCQQYNLLREAHKCAWQGFLTYVPQITRFYIINSIWKKFQQLSTMYLDTFLYVTMSVNYLLIRSMIRS